MLADLDPERRPRERMLRLGPDALSDAELVALLLGSGRRGSSVLDVARELLAAHGGLHGLSRAAPALLSGAAGVPGVGPAKATRVVAALALARRFGTSTDRRATVRTPADVARVAGPVLSGLPPGRLAVVACDRANRVLTTLVVPGVDAHADPPPVREVLTEALRAGAVAVALAHRHPDGDPAPRAADTATTRALTEAAGRCGLRVLDHLVLSPEAWASTADPVPGDGG